MRPEAAPAEGGVRANGAGRASHSKPAVFEV
jgi:hypothetical protein